MTTKSQTTPPVRVQRVVSWLRENMTDMRGDFSIVLVLMAMISFAFGRWESGIDRLLMAFIMCPLWDKPANDQALRPGRE